jgi:hypothetical protein
MMHERPAHLIGCLLALGLPPTIRKRRLLYTTAARIGFAPVGIATFTQGIGGAEELADSGQPRFGVDDIRRRLRRRMPRRNSTSWDWRQLGLESLEASPNLSPWHFQENTLRALADAYRELFANPFVALEWNLEWFMSTVRDLAAHIYENREFHLMPVLGDALLDAGCDHQLIQEHCRSTKPHARGCWVVDAILGKS